MTTTGRRALAPFATLVAREPSLGDTATSLPRDQDAHPQCAVGPAGLQLEPNHLATVRVVVDADTAREVVDETQPATARRRLQGRWRRSGDEGSEGRGRRDSVVHLNPKWGPTVTETRRLVLA